MAPSASINARKAIQASVQSAGRTAHTTLVSVTMEPTATNPMLMAEVQVKSISADQAAKNGATSTIPSATRTSIMLAAASAPPTAQPA